MENAARTVGLSPSSAYAFRNTAKGAAFAIGWTAAQLLQRQRLADLVASRAFAGQTVTVTRASGETVERHFFDNRLAMAVLTRLDRLAAGQVSSGAGAAPAAASAEAHAARLAAGEWDRYLDLLANDATPARAGLFLAARTADRATPGSPELAAISALARADLYDRTRAGIPAELDTADLDVEHRAGWTAEQWARAEAAGLLSVTAPAPAKNADGSPPHSQHSPEHSNVQPMESEPIWWCDSAEAWRTSFPPPRDFDGQEEGRFGSDGYQRELTGEEEDIVERSTRPGPDQLAAAAADRDAFLAALAGEREGPVRGVGQDEENDDDQADQEDALWNLAGYDNGCDVDDWVKVAPEGETERVVDPAVETR